jgi:hypothetical protein
MAETTAEDKATTDAPATSEFIQWARRVEQLAQAEVRRQIEEHLAAGRPVYCVGTGADSGKLFQHLPDGRRCEVQVLEDGTIERVCQLPE